MCLIKLVMLRILYEYHSWMLENNFFLKNIMNSSNYKSLEYPNETEVIT